jgi:hypothetical protein
MSGHQPHDVHFGLPKCGLSTCGYAQAGAQADPREMASPLKKGLTLFIGLTRVARNTPAKPRLAPANTLKSRGFFYAWRKQA